MIPLHIKNRKGARSFANLDAEVIEYLNRGEVETANFIEWLATDQLVLLKRIVTTLDKVAWYDVFYEAVNAQKKPTANSNTKVIGQTLGQLTQDKEVLSYMANHVSDIPRCWAAFASIMTDDIASTTEVLKKIEPFAADTHFGVREVAIFATKDFLIADIDTAISVLSGWVSSNDENIRRFAGEALRPVGVWVKKIAEFQEFPEKGLPIIEPLKSDPSKYVRDTVGNWLNDASKSQPGWVTQICKQWLKESPTKETAYIVKKAMRTIEKNKK